MRNVIAILLIVASIGIYYGYTKSVFADIKSMKVQLADYDSTLQKAQELKDKEQSITDIINSFDKNDRDKLDKMIPNNADNVRLIIDIQNIAQGSGLTIKNIKVDDVNKQGMPAAAPTATTSNLPQFGATDNSHTYNSVSLSFSVVSNYDNFVLFVSKLEQSLRLVDITSLTIKSNVNPSLYDFDITLRAYWIK